MDGEDAWYPFLASPIPEGLMQRIGEAVVIDAGDQRGLKMELLGSRLRGFRR